MAKTERRKIKIVSVGSWRPAGKGEVLEFAGDDRVNYETWSKELAEYIKVGAEIDASVDFSEKVSGDKTYYHNTVTQIFVDGQPVRSKGRNFGQDSPEKMASIENQKRADLICQLWIAGKIVDNDPLVVKAKAWLSLLGITPAPVAAPVVTKSMAKPSETIPGQFTNAGEFLTACSKPPLKLNKTQVLAALKQASIKAPDSLEGVNFDDAYQVLIEAQKEAKA
jgi:hypothetical protein